MKISLFDDRQKKTGRKEYLPDRGSWFRSVSHRSKQGSVHDPGVNVSYCYWFFARTHTKDRDRIHIDSRSHGARAGSSAVSVRLATPTGIVFVAALVE